jgi:hypothetical protein
LRFTIPEGGKHNAAFGGCPKVSDDGKIRYIGVPYRIIGTIKPYKEVLSNVNQKRLGF